MAMTARIARRTHRHGEVFRRALQREASRLRDPRRIAAVVIMILVFAVAMAALYARGEQAGADARAYWAGVRLWLGGGDPYDPTGPFLPYVYAPWMLPLFLPWALLPWEVAWFVWRVGTILALLWTVDWAYRRRPLATAVVLGLLLIPFMANLDTGNINLQLTLALWGAQFVGPVSAGALWALATWMKWAPAPFWLVLAPRARGWGLIWLALATLLSILMLPLTILQLQALFGFGPRPIRLDYLVFLWALVPWFWRHSDPLWWLRPSSWPGLRNQAATTARTWRWRLADDPRGAARIGLGDVRTGFRRFVGLEPAPAPRPEDKVG